jgi:hypothetical protein
MSTPNPTPTPTQPEAPVRVGEVVTLTTRSRAGESTGRVRVNWIEDREDFWYVGWASVGHNNALGIWGASRFPKVGAYPYGCSVTR